MSDPAAVQKVDPFDAILADLSAKNPDNEVEPITYAGGRVIVRTPDEGAYAKWLADSGEKGKLAPAAKAFARRCILWPEPASVDDLFARKPALPLSIVNKLIEKAGGGDEVRLGK